MKILVVEDEPASLKLAHLVLSLPGINGLTLARQLKGQDSTRNIAIIAVTAFPERYPRELIFAAGCDGYLVKPISTRNLSRQVAEAAANPHSLPTA